VLNLREYQDKPARIADWLPWAGLVAPGVVLNKDGSFQRSLRYRGPDLESATQAELIATTARLNNALRRLASGWMLHIEADRHAAEHYPSSLFPDPVSWLVDEERRAYFASNCGHFESSYYLTLTYLPREDTHASASRLLYVHATRDGMDWRRQLSDFIAETDRFQDLLEGVVPESGWLDDVQTLSYLHGTVSTERQSVSVPDIPFHLDCPTGRSPANHRDCRPCSVTSISGWCRYEACRPRPGPAYSTS